MAALFYLILIPLQILTLPLAIAGVVMAGYTEWAVSKRLGVSYTAGQAIQPRWVLHYFGDREDPLTVRFMEHMPNESVRGFWLLLGPMWVAHRLTGYRPGLVRIPDPRSASVSNFLNWRTVQFDRIYQEKVPQVEQIVVLGAGYCLRALPFAEREGVRGFEVDKNPTQDFKLGVLKSAGIRHDHMTYVPVDFRTESWVEKLEEAGFDRTRPTLFHWESVALYLDEEVVLDTLTKVSALSAPGSVLACDWYGTGFTQPKSKALQRSIDQMKKIGEPFRSGLDMSDPPASVARMLAPTSFQVESLELMWSSTFGEDPFYAVVVASPVRDRDRSAGPSS